MRVDPTNVEHRRAAADPQDSVVVRVDPTNVEQRRAAADPPDSVVVRLSLIHI